MMHLPVDELSPPMGMQPHLHAVGSHQQRVLEDDDDDEEDGSASVVEDVDEDGSEWVDMIQQQMNGAGSS